ncbi:DUF3027 domain-containing protein [Nocardia rhamnosiphila]|uniref:DUF3027 domain-containing protein n=1 Tax=Nocardia rhamnosiphila TaxID=426716 RepID=UPI000B19E5C1|nr:DUF3027 domain-containing protein [Nocardia rhamnosiphila]
MSAVSVSDTEVRTILAGAVDLARSALVDLEPTGVGAHLGVRAEDECSATHRFEATLPGYRGWQWAVVVAAAPGADRVTVSESALLPGPDALIAPEFVPWEQRIRPGDLTPGDLLAPPADDPRLAPGYTATGDPEVDETAPEVGLGRKQVLSLEGRADAAERWYAEYGPDTEMAKAAPGSCESCGFYLPLAGALRACFGVCANAMGADGHVVHMGYGCGAHSDTQLPTGAGSPIYQAYDDAAIEVVAVPPKSPETAPGSEAAAEADVAPDAVVPGQAVVTAPPAQGAESEAGAPESRTATEAVSPAGRSAAAGPATSATAGPVATSAPGPAGESSPEPAVESAAESSTGSNVESAAESVAEASTESGPEPAAEPGTGSVAGTASGPAVETIGESVASPSGEAAAEATGDPGSESGPEPVGDPAAVAAHPADTAPAGADAADSANEPVEATAAGPAEPGPAAAPETADPAAERESAAADAEPETETVATDRAGAPAAGTESGEQTAPEAGDSVPGPADS